jgi:hypothetical protein
VQRGGGHKVGILEDTLMSKKEARERVGRQQEANRASPASAARIPPIGAKAQRALRGILHGSKKASPNACGDAQPDAKPVAKAVGETLPGFVGGREKLGRGCLPG